MTEAGGRRRAVWRRAVTVWAVAVAVGGGLTLWLQDTTAPQDRHGWQRSEPEPAPPDAGTPYDVYEDGCPPDDQDDTTIVACLYTTTR
ncbi:hypothetical protein [Streptomyces sp. DH24]|uniref:hypothetical protein n=1 Tax=Streptomyces sp. DH24 TaxID=3040123 RepID=UPI002441BE92|nr:hypothetical protein [Streptomyces sp. DH24]MDG9716582.1 hypothetical protein [Streptomyces sp. DH24]